MELMTVLEVLKLIGSVAAGIISIVTLFTIISKKPKKWFCKIIKEANEEQFKAMEDEFKKLHQSNEKSEKTDICILRHEITLIYENYKDQREIPERMRENLCCLYEDYIERGGNSYVKTIYSEMMTWKVK